ncbi:Acyl carrier protein [Seminavis robusta]|nr:Acyl carrier protein [Seminavis robusta]|eukprot:Sro1721_g293510.1 Acyl carrier protein (132) ;mRNA; f:5616-6112
MFLSAARLAVSRTVPRAVRSLGSSSNFVALRQRAPAVYTLRHFSSPPAFLNESEVVDRIMGVVKNFDQVDPSKVTAETKFADDLGLDSLDIVEVVMAIEDEFAIEIPDTEADAIASIGDAAEYISKHPMAK